MEPSEKLHPPEPSEETESPQQRPDTQMVFGRIQAEQSTIAKTIHQYFGSDAQEGAGALRLGIRHFDPIERADLDRRWRSYSFDGDRIDDYCAALEAERVLVLTGPRRIGATSSALLATRQLTARRKAVGALVFRHLDTAMQIDFDQLLGDRAVSRKVLVLSRALDSDNEDLRDFLESRDRRPRELLERRGAYLVLSATEAGSGSEVRIGSKAWYRSARPSVEELEQALAEIVAGTVPPDDPEGKRRFDAIRSDAGRKVICELGSLSKIQRFVDDYLPDVLGGTLDLEAAVARVDDVEGWFLREMPHEERGWTALLAALLCSCAGGSEGVPFLQYERMRRRLERYLQRQTRRDRELRELRELCADEHVLRRARLRVHRRPFPEPDRIAFEEPDSCQRLWNALVGPGLSLLALLEPLLTHLATSGEDGYLRQAALRALGRVGSVDPAALIEPRIDELIGRSRLRREHRPARQTAEDPTAFQSRVEGDDDGRAEGGDIAPEVGEETGGETKEEDKARAKLAALLNKELAELRQLERGRQLGYLLQGILAAEHADSSYAHAGRKRLERLLAAPDPWIVSIAVASLVPIMEADPEFACTAVCRVLDSRLEIEWEELRESDRQLAQLTEIWRKRHAIHAAGAHLEARSRLDYWTDLALLMEITSDLSRPLLRTTGEALRRLLAHHTEPRRALLHLTRSAKLNPETAAPLLSFFFLGPGGIGSRWSDPAAGMLPGLTHRAESLPPLAAFLVEVARGARTFPGMFAARLQRQFRQLLAIWAKEADASTPGVQKSYVEIIRRLIDSDFLDLSDLLREIGAGEVEPSEDELQQVVRLALDAEARTARMER